MSLDLTSRNRRADSPSARSEATIAGDYFVYLFAVIGYVVVYLRPQILPEKFSFDGVRIQAIAQGTELAFGDKAFGNVASVYALLDLAQHPLVAGFIGYSAFLAITLGVWARVRTVRPSGLTIFVACVALVFGSVYLGFYSKDVLVLPIVAIVLFFPRTLWVDIVGVVVMLLYAYWFRSYWVLVAGLYLAYRMARIQRRSYPSIIGSIIITTIALSMAVYLVEGSAPDTYRQIANDTRGLDLNAQSIISPIFTFGEPLSGILNNVTTAFFLVIPVPLLVSSGGGFYYAAITAVLAATWVATFAAIGRLRQWDPVLGAELIPSARAASLLMALLCVQALFEPDYGSAVRHVTPLLPCALLVCGMTLRPIALKIARPIGQNRRQPST